MSNLSELLPAGAGAKSASFVASGTLASGQTVALKTNGQVEAVSALTQSAGTPVVFEAGDVGDSNGLPSVAFDSNSNKIVIAYTDVANSGQGTVIVGTVSGTSISYGTAVVFETGSTSYSSVVFDSNSNKIVIAYRDAGDSNYGKAIVGTVSGTSISFGTAVTFETANSDHISATFDSNSNKVVIAYRDDGNSAYGTAIVGTVSGTSISFGTAVVYASVNAQSKSMAFDSNLNKVIIAFRNFNNAGYSWAVVGTVSGTSISFGTAVVYSSTGTEHLSVIFDSSNNKAVLTSRDSSNKGIAVVGTVSGTSISFGSAVIYSGSSTAEWGFAVFDSNSNKVVISYSDLSNSSRGTVIDGTVSGTSITFGTALVFINADANYIGSGFDSNLNKVVTAYQDANNSNYGTSVVIQTVSSNSADFIGITDQAIANTATGAVIVQGGVTTNPIGPYTLTVGSPNQFTSSTLTDPYTQVVYDSSNNKIVVLYRDSSNSDYGTAIVGTVSGTSISYGSPVIFEAAQSVLISATYDSNSNKVVVCYRDGGNSSYGTAIVGTVSGTSISFGTAAVFQSSSVSYVSSVQDSDTNKTIIAYRDNFNDGKSIVGTVSGTSISFGSAAIFNSGAVQYVSIGYDATNSRAVIAYENGTNGKAIVGTVSGTSISFGSAVTFLSGSESLNTTTTFDPSSGKVLIRYDYFASSAYQGTFGIVGTVSGTSISFGSEQYAFGAGYAQTSTDAVYDPDLNKIILVASTSENSYAGGSIVATISGTSVSFGAFNLFDSARTNYNSIAYDTTSNKSIIAYGADTTGGECLVGTASNALTIGTDYFVQTDGSLSTTTSTVPAGRALSATSILLEG